MGEKGSKPKQFKGSHLWLCRCGEKIYTGYKLSGVPERLRNIRQTGYASLYPSALHNRFVHSLGVFHLGKKAISSLETNIADQITGTFKVSKDDWNKMKRYFLYGHVYCMMLDILPFLIRARYFMNKVQCLKMSLIN